MIGDVILELVGAELCVRPAGSWKQGKEKNNSHQQNLSWLYQERNCSRRLMNQKERNTTPFFPWAIAILLTPMLGGQIPIFRQKVHESPVRNYCDFFLWEPLEPLTSLPCAPLDDTGVRCIPSFLFFQ